jgi:hypothetical protein
MIRVAQATSQSTELGCPKEHKGGIYINRIAEGLRDRSQHGYTGDASAPAYVSLTRSFCSPHWCLRGFSFLVCCGMRYYMLILRQNQNHRRRDHFLTGHSTQQPLAISLVVGDAATFVGKNTRHDDVKNSAPFWASFRCSSLDHQATRARFYEARPRTTLSYITCSGNSCGRSLPQRAPSLISHRRRLQSFDCDTVNRSDCQAVRVL